MQKRGARKGQWIFWIIALVAWFAPSQAHVYADDYSNGVVRFSYTSNHIRQQIDTENISDYSSLTFSVKARYGAYGPDNLYSEITLYDDAWSTLSTVRYPESGDITLLADYQVSTYTINPANAGLPSGIAWSDIKHIAVSVYGQDSESWGGNYGPIVDYVSLIGTKSDGTTYEKLTNHDFNNVTDNAPDDWTLYTYTAWDTCQGLYTSTLCVDRENAPYHTNYELSILDLCVNNIDDALVTKQSILSATGLNTEATFITAYNAGTWGVYIASGSGNFGEDYGNRPDVYCGNSQNNQPPNLDSNGGTKDYFWGGAGNDTVTQMWYSVFYGGYGDDTVSTLSEGSLFYGEGGDDTCTLLQTSSICDLGADEETVIVAPYFNAVQNLTATANEDGSVNLAWDAPVASNTEIYGYSINFVDFDDDVERGGWGVWTEAANTTYSLGHWMFDGSNPVTTGYGPVRFKVYAMSGPCAGVGEGSCLYGPSTNADATVLDPTPPTTTTTTTTTLPPTTTTTTLPLIGGNNGCGPYRAFTVTGSTGGTVWGSGPYTDDSTFAAAAVHAGLIEVGETAVIEPYLIDNYPSYNGSIANGVSTYTWGSGWCGYYIKLLGTETPSTTTTTTTTTTLPPTTTTTTEPEPTTTTTTTTEAPSPTTTTTPPYELPENVIWRTGSEGDSILVFTPEGKIFTEVLFASYGNPTGTDGQYQKGSCHAETSNQIIVEEFIGKSNGSLTFDNSTFGDPCGDTPKTYAIVLKYGNDPTPTTTTTTEVPTTTTTEVPTTTTSEVPTTTTEAPVTLPPDTVPEDTIVTTPDTTDGGPDGGTGSPPDTTSPETTVPESAPEEETTTTTPDIPVEETPTAEAVVDDILSGDLSPEELGNAVSDALNNTDSEEELVSVASALLASDLTSEEFASVVAEVFSQDLSDDALTQLIDQVFSQDLSDQEIAAVVDQVFTADVSDEAFAEVLNTIFEEPLSDEAFNSVIDAILDEPISDAAFDELVDVLGGDSVTEEQVQSAVTSIIDNGITESQAVSIATSGEVLQSITGDQASEIFAEVPISDITDEEAAALVEAVQNAPTEVKAAFESEIDIFSAGNVDTYVPIGSNVPVSTRRVIIAAAGLTMTMLPQPAPAPSSGGPVAATDNKNKNTGKRK